MSLKKKGQVIAISLLCIGLMLTLTVYTAASVFTGAHSEKLTANTSGVASTSSLGVYSDSACTKPLTSIQWGELSPGQSATKQIYVKNTQSVLLVLRLSTNKWTPINANGPLTLTWNRQNTLLSPGQSIGATITLTTSLNATGISSFTVQILLSGTSRSRL